MVFRLKSTLQVIRWPPDDMSRTHSRTHWYDSCQAVSMQLSECCGHKARPLMAVGFLCNECHWTLS
jgi:hypothetical protein